MPESELFQSYKSWLNENVERLSNQLKSQLDTDTLKFIDFRADFHDAINNFSKWDEVKEFQANAEKFQSLLDDSEQLPADEYNKACVAQKLMIDLDNYGKLKMVEHTIKELKQNPPRPSSKSRSYDQVVKGNVKISEVKNNNEYSHKIKFNKIGKFLQYQVWDPTGIVEQTHFPRYPSNDTYPRDFIEATKYIKENPDKVVVTTYPINDDRDVKLITGKEWVLYFNSVINFSPTTVMQIGYKNHVFVLKKAEINKNNKVVFYISTKEIQVNNNNNKSEQMKNLKKIPLGKHKNVRFDIDYGNSIDCLMSGDICSCPTGSTIFSTNTGGALLNDVNSIATCIWNQCDSGYSRYGEICYGYCQNWGGCFGIVGCCSFWGGWRNSLLQPCHHPECVSSYSPKFDCNGGNCYG